MVLIGSNYFQHADKELLSAKYVTKQIKRGFTANWFMKSLQNEEEVISTRLIYSPLKKRPAAFVVCCFPIAPAIQGQHLNHERALKMEKGCYTSCA